MFRVQENEDGTTVVYDSSTGKKIFVLRPEHQRRIPERTNVRRPINVVGPSRHIQSSDNETAQSYESDEDKDPIDIDSSSNDFPSSFDDDSEDYFNGTVTQDEFARCLNLVPKRTFEKEPLSEIIKEFPLRLNARNRAYRSNDDSFEEQKYQKLPDDLPLTSKLGTRFLNLNEHRNFLTKQKLSISLKKCEAFCRFPFNSPNPVECNFPKLRCREKKSYPTTVTTKATNKLATHVYSFGRRQRLERMKTLKTGLDKESRRLYRMCNAKKCSVVLNRLDEDVIQYWLSKKSEPIIITIEDSDEELVLSLPSQNLNIQLSVPSISADNIFLNDVSLVQNDATQLKIVTTHNQGGTSIKNVIPNKNLAESVLHSLLTSSSSSGLVRLPQNPIKQFNVCSSFKASSNTANKKDCDKNLEESVLHSLVTSAASSGLVRLPKNPLKQLNVRSSFKASNNTANDGKLAKSRGCRDCYVRLKDVTKLLHKLKDEYYVKYTKIRVPFYASYLASVSLVKRLQVNNMQEKPMRFGNGLVISTVIRQKADKTVASVIFPTSQSEDSVPPPEDQVLVPNGKRKNLVPDSENTDSVPDTENRASQFNLSEPRTDILKDGDLQGIPYIDLTVDSSPEKDSNPISSVPKQYLVTQFLFRCNGCGFRKMFSNQSSSSKAASFVKSAIHEHLVKFHSVDKPESFLSSYHDTFRNRSIIEAFPGYKGN